MTLRQLRYLLALDDHRHFGQAAKACFVAQPTLTAQLKKLEDNLGVQLIDRKQNPIVPTVIGARMIAQARIILAEVAEMHNLVDTETSSMAGEYTVGIIPTLAPYLLPLFIKSFGEAHPEVRLVTREMQSEQIIEGLNRQQLDLGLLVTPLEEKQLREIRLFYEPFLLYAAPGEAILQRSPLLPEHIETNDLWILEQGHCFRSQVLNICQAGDSSGHLSGEPRGPLRSFTFQAGSIETLRNMVRHNQGYTIIPELSVQAGDDQSYLRRFAEPQPAREVSMVVNRTFTRERLLEELRRAILAVIPEHFQKNNRFISIHWR